MAEIGVMAQPLADFASGDLPKRIGSALILAPLVLLLVYAGPPLFSGLVLAVAFIMTLEWARLCGADTVPMAKAGLGISVILAVVLAVLGMFGSGLVVVALGAGAVWFATAAHDNHGRARWIAGGIVYITLPCMALIWLRGDTAAGRDAIFWLLAVVWGMDVGAFVVGKTVGGPKLAPNISPK